MTDQDIKLIKKIQKGNQQAFRTLYDRCVGYALRTAYAITKDQSDAYDIVQEAFIKVFRNIKTFDSNKTFKPWFSRILINESKRYIRKSSKEKFITPSYESLDNFDKSQKDVKSYDNLEIALDNLHEDMRTLLILKYLNAFTEKEIAEMFDVSVGTIKSRLYKARNELRAGLGGFSK